MKEPAVELRLATRRDIDAILDLRYNVLDAPVGLEKKLQPSTKDFDSRSILVAAFMGDKAISTVRFEAQNEGDYLVRRMATDHSLQGQGIGSQVLQYAESLAGDRGASRFILHARIPAIPFYERHGYTLTGNSEIYDGDRNDEMVKLAE